MTDMFSPKAFQVKDFIKSHKVQKLIEHIAN